MPNSMTNDVFLRAEQLSKAGAWQCVGTLSVGRLNSKHSRGKATPTTVVGTGEAHEGILRVGAARGARLESTRRSRVKAHLKS